ncbi:MAG: response regulator transcription factor [Proteobacteria bacterium]|nr:response regulator transcription factor [Pseudomonadota bacterium]MBU4055907.1 response regulator transcription factor [Pseudomonadota bacterium]
MKVLLVEDDPKICSFIKKGLQEAGFVVDDTQDGEEALHFAEEIPYDVAIIDIMLPNLNGLSLIDLLRHRGIDMPILILSAKHTVDDRIKGLQRGADDYMVKPFIFAELLARVQALVRRSSKPIEANRVTCADLVVDLIERKVRRGGQTIDLQPKEYALLEYLIRNRGRTVSKTMIMEQIWDLHFDPQTNVVDVLVHRLRNKIDKNFPQKLIQTIRGIGYAIHPTDS